MSQPVPSLHERWQMDFDEPAPFDAEFQQEDDLDFPAFDQDLTLRPDKPPPPTPVVVEPPPRPTPDEPQAAEPPPPNEQPLAQPPPPLDVEFDDPWAFDERSDRELPDVNTIFGAESRADSPAAASFWRQGGGESPAQESPTAASFWRQEGGESPAMRVDSPAQESPTAAAFWRQEGGESPAQKSPTAASFWRQEGDEPPTMRADSAAQESPTAASFWRREGDESPVLRGGVSPTQWRAPGQESPTAASFWRREGDESRGGVEWGEASSPVNWPSPESLSAGSSVASPAPLGVEDWDDFDGLDHKHNDQVPVRDELLPDPLVSLREAELLFGLSGKKYKLADVRRSARWGDNDPRVAKARFLLQSNVGPPAPRPVRTVVTLHVRDMRAVVDALVKNAHALEFSNKLLLSYLKRNLSEMHELPVECGFRDAWRSNEELLLPRDAWALLKSHCPARAVRYLRGIVRTARVLFFEVRGVKYSLDATTQTLRVAGLFANAADVRAALLVSEDSVEPRALWLTERTSLMFRVNVIDLADFFTNIAEQEDLGPVDDSRGTDTTVTIRTSDPRLALVVHKNGQVLVQCSAPLPSLAQYEPVLQSLHEAARDTYWRFYPSIVGNADTEDAAPRRKRRT